MTYPFIDITGKKFGKLSVIKFARLNKHGQTMWECLCECGKTLIVRGTDMRRGEHLSCGCARHHGDATKGRITKEWRAWHSMRDRCFHPNNAAYQDYGARGITVCDRWQDSYQNFLADMGRAPSARHTLERINNDGNYEPGNCKWATRTEQQRNRRGNVIVTIDGVTGVRTEVCEKLGLRLKYKQIAQLMEFGYTPQESADITRYGRYPKLGRKAFKGLFKGLF